MYLFFHKMKKKIQRIYIINTINRNKNIQIKKDILLELHECIGTVNVVKSFQESTLQELVSMVERNIFRPLPESVPDFDPEEDDPILDPAWMHLQLMYFLFLCFINIIDMICS